MRIEVNGMDAVLSRLDQVQEGLRGELVEKALLAGALLIANDAKQRAPYITGNLRRSIHVGGFGSEGGLEGDTTGTDIGGRGRNSVQVGTNVVYARRIEYGFSGEDKLGRRYNQSAQPFLRPAADAQRDAAIREVGEALTELIGAALR